MAGTTAPVVVVLVGQTGSGKSSLGNLILRSTAFKASSGAASCTSKVQQGSTSVHGAMVTVVDCPGFHDTAGKEVLSALADVLDMLNKAHKGSRIVILLVHAVERSNDNVANVFHEMLDEFGAAFGVHAMMVLTKADVSAIDNDTKEIEWLQSCSASLKRLRQRIGERAVFVQNPVAVANLAREALNAETRDASRARLHRAIIDFAQSIADAAQLTSHEWREAQEAKIRQAAAEQAAAEARARQAAEDAQRQMQAQIDAERRRVEKIHRKQHSVEHFVANWRSCLYDRAPHIKPSAVYYIDANGGTIHLNLGFSGAWELALSVRNANTLAEISSSGNHSRSSPPIVTGTSLILIAWHKFSPPDGRNPWHQCTCTRRHSATRVGWCDDGNDQHAGLNIVAETTSGHEIESLTPEQVGEIGHRHGHRHGHGHGGSGHGHGGSGHGHHRGGVRCK